MKVTRVRQDNSSCIYLGHRPNGYKPTTDKGGQIPFWVYLWMETWYIFDAVYTSVHAFKVYILQVQTVVADLKGRGGKEWRLTYFVSPIVPLCDGGLVEVAGLIHKFLCMTSLTPTPE